MLSFHCKQTDQLAFRKHLEKYFTELETTKAGGKLSKSKKEALAAYDEDITSFEQTRNAARSAGGGKQQDGQRAIAKYYHTLHAVENKIPFNETEVRAQFTWADSVRKGKKCSRFDAGLDLAGFLFNHAALSSQIGATTDRSSVEGLKISCKHFQNAAGALVLCQHIVSKRAFGQLTIDLSAEGLNLMESSMLAQAQHCVCEKALRDGMKGAILAKLCQGTVDLFSQAHAQFSNSQITAHYNKTWSGLLKMHIHHYRAKVHLHQARAAKAQDEYGVEIAHLRVAMGEVQQAKTTGKAAGAGNVVGGFLNDIEKNVQEDLTSVERDNSLIYNMTIPPAADLPSVESKVMVKPSDLSQFLPEPEGLLVPFQSVIPAAAAAAISEYKKRLDGLLTEKTELLTKQTNEAKEVMAEMNLEALLDQSEGLPESAVEGVNEMEQNGGLPQIDSLLEQIVAMAEESELMLNKLKKGLDDEESQDRSMRQQFPQMASRITESSKINKHMRKVSEGLTEKLDGAANADALVANKYNKHRDNLVVLANGVEFLKKKCPSAGNPVGANSDTASALKLVVDTKAKLETILERRSGIITRLSNNIEKDDIEGLLVSAAGGYKDVVDKSFTKHEAIVREIQENIAQQEGFVSVLVENTQKARQGRGEAESSREEFLKIVSVGLNAYREVTEGLREGLMWHSRFQDTLGTHQGQVDDFVMSRKMEKQMFAENMSKEFAGLAPRVVDAIPADDY